MYSAARRATSTVRVLAASAAIFGALALGACGGDGDDNRQQSTDPTPPSIRTRHPSNGDTSVSVNTAIVVEFDEAMDEASLATSVTLSGPSGSVAGTAITTSTTVTFTPGAPLEVNSTYTATIDAKAKDVSGNALQGAGSWTFTTDSVATYYVGGTVSDLTDASGAGDLRLGMFVSTGAGTTTRYLTLTENGSFLFLEGVPAGATYAVYANQNPATQHCVAQNSTGTITNAHVTNIAVMCRDGFAPTHSVGGSVSGLPDLDTVTLLLGHIGPAGTRNDQSLIVDTNGSFTFTAAIEEGKLYHVAVQQQPLTAHCSVSNGIGTILDGNVTHVEVTCVPKYPLVVTVSGLANFGGIGAELQLTQAGEEISILESREQDGTWEIYGAYALPDATYALMVYNQPAHATCTPGGGSNGDGTGIMTTSAAQLTLICVPTLYSVSGSVAGLVGSGLVLTDALGGSVSIDTPAISFSLPNGLVYQDTYSIAVDTQPSEPEQVCKVALGEGSVAGDVTTIEVSCVSVSPVYPLAGTNWNQWVAVTGETLFDNDDTPCGTGTAASPSAERCLHAGELRKVVTGAPACDGLSASDALGAFDWSCAFEAGRAVFYGVFKADARLSELLDLSVPGWLPNHVTVSGYAGASLGGASANQTPDEVWWANPVVINNDGSNLSESGTIYVVTQPAPGTSYHFASNTPGIGLVIAPDVTLDGDVYITGSNFNSHGTLNAWIEGVIHRTTSTEKNDLIAFNYAANVVLRGVEVSSADAGACVYAGVKMWGPNNRLEGLRASSCYVGVEIGGSSRNPVLRGVVASENVAHGVSINASSDAVLSNIVATSNGASGLRIENSPGLSLSDVQASANLTYGIHLFGSVSGFASRLSSFGNANSGVYVSPGTGALHLVDVRVANNEVYGLHILGGAGFPVIAQNINASNNFAHGVYLQSTSANLSNVLAASNGSDGVRVTSSSGANQVHLNGITAVHSGGNGFTLGSTTASDTVVASALLSVANGGDGLLVSAIPGTVDIRDVAATNNGNRGIAQVNSGTLLIFSGDVRVGGNANGACFNNGASGLATTTCAALAGSSIALATGLSASDAFEGMVSTDSANQSHAAGQANYPSDPASFDWVSFDTGYRAWGKHSANAFPNNDQIGRWTTGGGHIWDWSLVFGEDVAWALYTLDPAAQRTSGTLDHAWELVGDGIGDEDGLCESNENCLFAPNIGAYQGHVDVIQPDLIVAGTVDDELTGIVVLRYGTNGYPPSSTGPEVPPGWTCGTGYYSGGDGCDCGCGEVDPDCADATVGSCDYCDNADACSQVSGCGALNPSNNAVCD